MSEVRVGETEAFWKGSFGDSYTERNKVDWTTRISFWSQVLRSCSTKVNSVLEVGCNSGANLRAIREADPSVRLTGIDINEKALAEARSKGFECYEQSALLQADMWKNQADLVATVGVLIHVPPADIDAVMRGIINASRRYVLAVEYWAHEEEEVVYRGNEGRLWKRPFGTMYQDLGLRFVTESDPGAGFDKCVAHLMEKV